MTRLNNITFGAGQASPGVYTTNPLSNAQNFSDTDLASGFQSLTVRGAFNQPNDQVTIVETIAGLRTTFTGTYLGFSQNGTNPPVYYFSAADTGLGGIGFAVTEGTLPAVGLAVSINNSATNAPAPCFVTGTRIRTVRGEVAVEDIEVGDRVLTASGASRPVTWIGRRDLACARHRAPHEVWPVRVSAGAFGAGLPARDLWLSPDHAVCVSVLDEVLIPIKYLLNAATIVQVPRERVTYWHVELDAHDIVLAEGLPSESFLDTGVRDTFDNGDGPVALHPGFARRTLADFCRPLIQDGPIVEAVRRRLAARAEALGWSITAEPDLRLVADGAIIRPEIVGATARFSVPAAARDVRLVSRTYEPLRIDPRSGDARRLGVPLRSIVVRDGAGARRVALDDARLGAGFSFVQGEGADRWRWTDGDAAIPGELWDGARGPVTLEFALVPFEGWAGAGVYSVLGGTTPALAA